MATYCSVLAWRILGTGEPGWLLSMGSHRVGHNWSDLAAAAAELYHYLWDKYKLNYGITYLGFPDSSVSKESACSAGGLGLSLGQEDPVEKGMATQARILEWVAFPFFRSSQCRRPEFSPWIGKIWRRERLPIPVFWPGEFHGLYRTWGCKEWDMTEQLSLS